jgi:hypothetical protein
MKILFCLFSSLLFIEAWAQTSYVPSTHLLKKKGYQLQLGGDYFSTTKTADDKSGNDPLPDGASFNQTQVEFGGLYGATDQLQIGLGARLRLNQSTFINALGEEVNAASEGLQSTFVSGHYAFRPVGQFQYTLEGIFRYTPYTNEIFKVGNEEELILGDDGNEYSFGLGVTYSFRNNNFLTLRGGYRRPGSEISDEIYWQAEGAMVWKYLALVAGVDGVSSLNRDPYEDDPENRPIFNTGVSSLYNGMNREWITPYVGVNLALGDLWRVELRGSQVIRGTSTDIGSAFGIQLVRRVDQKNKGKLDSRFKSYDLEATISKVSAKKGYVVIDKGLADEVQKGMVFDFYEFDYVGGNVLVARGTVIQVKGETAVVKITGRFHRKKQIKEGLIGRSSLK